MPTQIEDMSLIENRPASMAKQFQMRVAQSGPREAFRQPAGEGQPWKSTTWDESKVIVDRLAAGLLALGLQSEQRVGIAAATRVEWIYADLAIMCAGGATTTVYPTTMASDVAYILADSECRVVFAEDAEQLAKLKEHRSELPNLEKVVLIDGEGDGDWVMSWSELQELGEAALAKDSTMVDRAVEAISPDQLATLIYTSGTTGRPKGVRLAHSAWTYEGASIQSRNILSEADLQFLWLPMAHSFGKVLLSTQLACGFATAVDGRVDKIVDNLAIVKPTFMGAAPRIFEKAHARIVMMQAQEGGAKEKIFNKAFEVGLKADELKKQGKPLPFLLGIQHSLFDKLVFSKIRDRFGGRVRFFISGSAALNRDIATWFNAAGIQILEGYGLTESSAGTFVNLPEDNRYGSVGIAFPGTEVRLGDGDEVQVRGPGVMQGYHNLPEATAEALTDDGWLHTGDKGSLDADGYLTITGRIKELFKTSGGKYIAPPLIEAKFKAVCPYASQFMVFGNDRNYCVALVAVDPDAIADWAQQNGLGGKSYSEIVADPKAVDMIQGYVDQLNAELNRWETIKKFRLLDHDLTIESGELTPSLKVKRNVIEDKYKSLIDQMYAS